jgi:ELWxxDGT repeat protein
MKKNYLKLVSLAVFCLGASTATNAQKLFKDLVPGMSGSYAAGSYPQGFTNVKGTMYFYGNEGSPTSAFDLFKTDGTAAGTVVVKSAIIPYTTFGSPINYFSDFNGTVVFATNTNNVGFQLWKTDGTSSGTAAIKTFTNATHGANSFPQRFTTVGSTLYFSADNGNGVELWKSDGTTAGSSEVIDLYPGSYSGGGSTFQNSGLVDGAPFIGFMGKVYFVGANGSTPPAIYSSDGTASGTKSFFFGSGIIDFFTVFNNTLYFDDDHGNVYKTDGLSPAVQITGVTGVKNSLILNNKLYFSGTNLYSSDGTLIKANAGIIKGALQSSFYTEYDHGYPVVSEYYKSDGTVAGTSASTFNVVGTASFDTINGKMYKWHGPEHVYPLASNTALWVTDGTDAGTKTIPVPTVGFYVLNKMLFYQNYEAATGSELWVYDPSIVTSIDKVTESKGLVKLFPNPSSGQITIDLNGSDISGNCKFALLNSLGQLVKETTLSDKTRMDVQNLPQGFYFYQIQNKEGKIETGKILINY